MQSRSKLALLVALILVVGIASEARAEGTLTLYAVMKQKEPSFAPPSWLGYMEGHVALYTDTPAKTSKQRAMSLHNDYGFSFAFKGDKVTVPPLAGSRVSGLRDMARLDLAHTIARAKLVAKPWRACQPK